MTLGASEREPVLVRVAVPADPKAIVLLLHGGRENGYGRVPARRLSFVRMRPFARAVHERSRDAAVALLRYRYRGWNAPDADPVRDTEWALEQLVHAHGTVPVILVGHSMGARAALRAAGHPQVVAVAGLAPWLPRGEPIDQLRERDALLVHGTADVRTSPKATVEFAQTIAPIARRLACVQVKRSSHGMLQRARLWHDLTASFVDNVVNGSPLPGALLEGFAAGARGKRSESETRVEPTSTHIVGPMSVAPPTIEMLWESVDPQIALQRFGFADAASTAQWVTGVLEAEWGISVVACERVVLSAGNALAWVTASDQRQLIAKWSVHPALFARLAHVSRLTSWLGTQGFSVSAPISPLHGAPRAEVGGASMELQAVVPGALLDVRDPGQVRAAGAAHAALHGLLADYPGADKLERRRRQRAAEPLVDRITHWLQSEAHRYPDTLTKALRQSLEETSAELPPVQLVHNDFRAANLLCRGSHVVAVLDFEEAALDHAVVDVARAAVLLGTRFRHWQPIPPETRDTFLAGYGSVRPLSPAEAVWLRTLILWTTMQLMHGWKPDEWLVSAMDEASHIVN